MPEFPITDTHVHLADKDALQYAWLKDNEALTGTYELANYDTACGGIDVGSDLGGDGGDDNNNKHKQLPREGAA